MKHLFLNLYRLVDESNIAFGMRNPISGKMCKVFIGQGIDHDEYTKFPFINVWVRRLK